MKPLTDTSVLESCGHDRALAVALVDSLSILDLARTLDSNNAYTVLPHILAFIGHCGVRGDHIDVVDFSWLGWMLEMNPQAAGVLSYKMLVLPCC